MEKREAEKSRDKVIKAVQVPTVPTSYLSTLGTYLSMGAMVYPGRGELIALSRGGSPCFRHFSEKGDEQTVNRKGRYLGRVGRYGK